MKIVPCINCLKSVEVKNKNVIAALCEDCKTDDNIKKIGIDFTKHNLEEVLQKFKEKPNVNEFGERM